MYEVNDVVQYYIKKNLYWSEFCQGWYPIRRWNKQNLETCYVEARRLYRVPVTFEKWCRLFDYYTMDNYHWFRHPDYKRPEKKNTGAGFVKKPHHKKKVLTLEEQDKRDRAKKKRVHQHRGIKWYHKTTGWKWYRTNANRKERRRVKNAIKGKDLNDSMPIKCYYYDYEDYEYCDATDNAWTNWIHPHKREVLEPWDYY